MLKYGVSVVVTLNISQQPTCVFCFYIICDTQSCTGEGQGPLAENTTGECPGDAPTQWLCVAEQKVRWGLFLDALHGNKSTKMDDG